MSTSRGSMSDDFCLIHGYEHMKHRKGDPIPYCEACDSEAEMKRTRENQYAKSRRR
jgi:hypothetical protein